MTGPVIPYLQQSLTALGGSTHATCTDILYDGVDTYLAGNTSDGDTSTSSMLVNLPISGTQRRHTISRCNGRIGSNDPVFDAGAQRCRAEIVGPTHIPQGQTQYIIGARMIEAPANGASNFSPNDWRNHMQGHHASSAPANPVWALGIDSEGKPGETLWTRWAGTDNVQNDNPYITLPPIVYWSFRYFYMEILPNWQGNAVFKLYTRELYDTAWTLQADLGGADFKLGYASNDGADFGVNLQNGVYMGIPQGGDNTVVWWSNVEQTTDATYAQSLFDNPTPVFMVPVSA